MSSEIPESVKESLKSIGLTDYEISIYLTLISRGPMDARELSDASGVPYSRIYNILTQLEKEKNGLSKIKTHRHVYPNVGNISRPGVCYNVRFNSIWNN